MTDPKACPHTIPVVHKTVDVLRAIALSGNRGELSVKALAAETGISSITCYRILRTLIANDWVRPILGGGHELSEGFLALAGQSRPLDGLIAAARPELARLARKTELTVKISVRQEDRAVTICRCESPRETAVSVREGAAFPLAFGSSGAVLLSVLKHGEAEAVLRRMPAACWKYQTQKDVLGRIGDLRERGYCVDAGTHNPGQFALSVPVCGRGGEVAAALTAIGFPDDLRPACHGKIKSALQACARAITKRLTPDLGGQASPVLKKGGASR